MEVLTAVTVMISLLQYNAMVVSHLQTFQKHPLASSSTLKMVVCSSESYYVNFILEQVKTVQK